MELITTFFPPRRYNKQPSKATETLTPKHIYQLPQYQQFCVPLSDVLRTYRSAIPPVMKNAIQYLSNETALKTEYIFKKSPAALRTQNIQEVANGGHTVYFDNALEAAAIIKLFLREMCDPLIPTSVYKILMDFPTIAKEEDRILKAIYIIDKVPRDHKPLLWKLIKLLYQASLHEEDNHMGSSQLGAMIGPSLCWANDSVYMKPKDMTALAYFATFLIEHASHFFKFDPENIPDGAWHSTIVNRKPKVPQVRDEKKVRAALAQNTSDLANENEEIVKPTVNYN